MLTEKRMNRELGQWLKTKRRERRITVEIVGNRMGCDHSTISHYESGRNTMSAIALKKYCDAINLDMTEAVRFLQDL